VTRVDAQSAVGTLDQLPDLVATIDGGPAILIIGDVVAHSAPWRQQHPGQAISQTLAQLLETAQ
jgi:uroporphyrin-III C-methyltransferase/precorrin-2 dehydrogenase/sirohydrochlorin ferrochelatase